MTVRLKVSGLDQTRANLKRLVDKSPARARAAVNRTIGVARVRTIKSLARQTGVSQSVLGGRKGSGRRGIKGRGYIKQVKASRFRSKGALVALVEGVLFRRLGRKTLGRSQAAPGGRSQPFRQKVRGIDSLFERAGAPARTSGSGKRKNLPIREVRIALEPHASRALRIIMARVSRTVYPAKIWEELQKVIKPVR